MKTQPLSDPPLEVIECRRFFLFRYKDVSGVSGIGKVAEGVEFDNGMCALSFSSTYQHVNTYANMRAVQKVHGHGGKTVVHYVDGPLPAKPKKRRRNAP